MQNVSQTAPASKVFYAHLFEDAGVLAKVGGQILFLADESGTIVEIEPSMVNFLTVLGEVGLADSQAAHDKIRGGYARIATTRSMEVA